MSGWFWSGLVLAAILILVPAAMVMRIALGIAAGGVAHARSRGRAARCEVPGLGMLHTDDGHWWSGEIDGLSITIETAGEPPTAENTRAMLATLKRLDEIGAEAESVIRRAHADEPEVLDGLEPEGLIWREEGSFDVEFGAGEWSHHVHFADGRATSTSSMH
jgi:hypothetical protein